MSSPGRLNASSFAKASSRNDSNYKDGRGAVNNSNTIDNANKNSSKVNGEFNDKNNNSVNANKTSGFNNNVNSNNSNSEINSNGIERSISDNESSFVRRPHQHQVFRKRSNKELAPLVVGDKKPLKSLKLLVIVITALLAIYFSAVYAVMNSDFLQSFIVYMHKVDLPFENLDNLFMYGLSNARNLNITTADNVTLRAWHMLPAGEVTLNSLELVNSNDMDKLNEYYDHQLGNAKRVFVYCHGNSASRGFPYRVNFIRQLASQLDAHVIAFDYRGFADSEGMPTEAGTLMDTSAVIKLINDVTMKHNPHNPIGYLSHNSIDNAGQGSCANSSSSNSNGYSQPHLFFYGHSLGTAITVAQAVDLDKHASGSNFSPSKLSGIVLDCPFTDLPEAALSHPAAAAFRIFPFVKKLLKTRIKIRYPSVEKIGNITVPIILMHGQEDEKLPPKHSHALKASAEKNYQIFKQDRDLDNAMTAANIGDRPLNHVEIPKADHGNVFHSALWLQELSKFVKTAESWTEKKLQPLFCNKKSSD